MNGNMGQLLGDALLVVFTFFGVVPVLMNTVSQFGVLKRFADEMVREGVIAEESWWDDDVTPAMFREELMAGSGPGTPSAFCFSHPSPL